VHLRPESGKGVGNEGRSLDHNPPLPLTIDTEILDRDKPGLLANPGAIGEEDLGAPESLSTDPQADQPLSGESAEE
jgi:hypothetical protein